MYYIIYKITNKINNKYYIGKHKTDNINDSYMGSGVYLKRAMKKYGKDNFIKEILFIFDNEISMNEKEKELVLIGEDTYNLCAGGKGGFDYINRNGLNKGSNNVMHRPEIAKKVSMSLKKTRNLNKKYYDKISIENLKKTWQQNKGKKRPEHSEFMKENSYFKEMWSDENKEKSRDRLSSWFLVISPDGKQYKTNRLQDFCENKNLPYTSIWKTSVINKHLTKGKAKGWICQRIIAQ